MVMKSKFLPWVSIGTKLCVSAEEEYKLRHMFSIHSGFLHPQKNGFKKWLPEIVVFMMKMWSAARVEHLFMKPHLTSKDPLSSLQQAPLHPTKELPGSAVY